MGILDIFKGKKAQIQQESNTVLGQTQLGNQVIYGVTQQGKTAQQLLYVVTGQKERDSVSQNRRENSQKQ